MIEQRQPATVCRSHDSSSEPAGVSGFIHFLLLLLLSAVALPLAVQGQSSLSEHQVKALFLFNFAKYVDWPADAFSSPDAAIVIGMVGHNACAEPLAKILEGKNVSGRALVVREVERPEEMAQCQILFISDLDVKKVKDILVKVTDRPILTVGDVSDFARSGGVIGFVKKEGKVRLEIDLGAARRAKLELSSKLLSVADSVLGKP